MWLQTVFCGSGSALIDWLKPNRVAGGFPDIPQTRFHGTMTNEEVLMTETEVETRAVMGQGGESMLKIPSDSVKK